MDSLGELLLEPVDTVDGLQAVICRELLAAGDYPVQRVSPVEPLQPVSDLGGFGVEVNAQVLGDGHNQLLRQYYGVR